MIALYDFSLVKYMLIHISFQSFTFKCILLWFFKEPWNGWSCKGSLEDMLSIPVPLKGPFKSVVQGHVQMASEYLQGWGLYNSLGKMCQCSVTLTLKRVFSFSFSYSDETSSFLFVATAFWVALQWHLPVLSSLVGASYQSPWIYVCPVHLMSILWSDPLSPSVHLPCSRLFPLWLLKATLTCKD